MEIKGVVRQHLEVQSGTSKAGKAWSKQEIIIETLGEYPKEVCIAIWGDKKVPLVGETATFSIELSSRGYNGKWYTEVKAWKIEIEQTELVIKEEYQDDLPF